MFIGCPLAEVMNVQLEEATFLGALHHAFRKRGPADFRKQRNYINTHWGKLPVTIVYKVTGESDYDQAVFPDVIPVTFLTS